MKKYLLAGAALALTLSAAGIAQATPLVTNGDFSQTFTPAGANPISPGTPTEMNYSPSAFTTPSYGEFVTGWTTLGGPGLIPQNIVWFPNATAASGTNAEDFDTSPLADLLLGLGYVSRPLLPSTVTAPPDDGAFIGMQSNLANMGIQQTINDLTIGQSYTVSFDWAATMDNIDTSSAATSQLTASIDGKSLTTPEQTVSGNGPFSIFGVVVIPASHTFNGWLSESFDFVADTTSSTLTFLAGGSPAGVPPYALLSNVSITPKATPVPEPGSLALMGIGLLGLGFAIRRHRGIS